MFAIRSKQSGQYWTGLGTGLGAWSDDPADAMMANEEAVRADLKRFWPEDNERLEVVPVG